MHKCPLCGTGMACRYRHPTSPIYCTNKECEFHKITLEQSVLAQLCEQQTTNGVQHKIRKLEDEIALWPSRVSAALGHDVDPSEDVLEACSRIVQERNEARIQRDQSRAQAERRHGRVASQVTRLERSRAGLRTQVGVLDRKLEILNKEYAILRTQMEEALKDE